MASNEENWRLQARIEVKSGKQTAGISSFFYRALQQAPDVIGDPRPFILVAATEPNDMPLLVIRADHFDQLYSER